MPINRNIQRKINIKPSIVKKQTKQKSVEFNRANINSMSKIVPKNKVKRPNVPPHRDENNKLKTIWSGQSVYIVGGGPSLKGFNWNHLKGKHTIAINKAFKVIPWSEVLYWTDARFYRWHKHDIDALEGIKVTCRNAPCLSPNIILLTTSGKTGIDKRPNFIRAGNSSGFAAINVAYHLGVKKIYLLGFDMESSDKNTHWHEGYGIRHDHNIYQRNMISNFDGIYELLKSEGIEIWNANPNSQLKSIPRCNLEDALNDCPTQTS
jgi:hypothetical protein